MSVRVTLLGTSAGGPMATRNTTSAVLASHDRLTVLDTGGGFCRAFLQAGFNPQQIDRIIISHTHPDHTAELPLAIQMYYLSYAKDPLPVFVPQEFVEPFRAYLNAVYLIPERLPFHLELQGYANGQAWPGDYSIEATANGHLHKYRDWVEKLNLPNQCQAHSFSIASGKKKLYWSSDIGSYADAHAQIKAHDVIVLESAHLNLDEFFADVQHHPAKQFILTHLVSEEQASELNEKLMVLQLGNVTVAEDGYCITLH